MTGHIYTIPGSWPLPMPNEPGNIAISSPAPTRPLPEPPIPVGMYHPALLRSSLSSNNPYRMNNNLSQSTAKNRSGSPWGKGLSDRRPNLFVPQDYSSIRSSTELFGTTPRVEEWSYMDSKQDGTRDDWSYMDPEQHGSREGQWPLYDYANKNDLSFADHRQESVVYNPYYMRNPDRTVDETPIGHVDGLGRMPSHHHSRPLSKTHSGWACIRCGHRLPRRNVYPGVQTCQTCIMDGILSPTPLKPGNALRTRLANLSPEDQKVSLAAAAAACQRRGRLSSERFVFERVNSTGLLPASSSAQAYLATMSLLRTCISCTEEILDDISLSQPMTTECTHDNNACQPCVQQWIETQLTSQGWERIRCLECREMMGHADVFRHATRETFERYDHLATRAVLANDPNFIWCRNEGCGSGQIHEGGEAVPLFQCRACGSRYCIVCDERWHEEETCSAFARRMNGDSPTPDAEDQFGDIQQMHPNFHEGTTLGSSPSPTGHSWQEYTYTANRTFALQLSNDEDGPNSGWSGSSSHWNDDFGEHDTDTSSSRESQRAAKVKGFMKKCLMKDFGKRPCAVTPQSTGSDVWAAQYLQSWSGQTTRQTHLNGARMQERFNHSAAVALHQQFEREEKNRRSIAQQRSAIERQDRQRREADDREQQEYQKRKAEEKQGEQTVRSTSKPCPRCKWNIQKASGCDHMTCFKCRYEFCYLCLADYNDIRRRGNHAHKTTCTLYRGLRG